MSFHPAKSSYEDSGVISVIELSFWACRRSGSNQRDLFCHQSLAKSHVLSLFRSPLWRIAPVVVAGAGGISGANDPSSSGKPTGAHPKTARKRPFSRTDINRSGTLRYLMSIRTAPEQNCRKTAPLPLATGSLPVSLPAYCNSRPFFIGNGESAYVIFFLSPYWRVNPRAFHFFQMAISLT